MEKSGIFISCVVWTKCFLKSFVITACLCLANKHELGRGEPGIKVWIIAFTKNSSVPEVTPIINPVLRQTGGKNNKKNLLINWTFSILEVQPRTKNYLYKKKSTFNNKINLIKGSSSKSRLLCFWTLFGTKPDQTGSTVNSSFRLVVRIWPQVWSRNISTRQLFILIRLYKYPD